ncbi:MAG: NAD(P)-dependent alcohol dehydrogenase [Actinobacteria bacterium]|nr:NAD(P)-dependent alcohol dehydrogenase [Actinomycetota bacterium]
MKAFVFRSYGNADVLESAEVAKPVPKDDEVLIRVRAVSINDWDWQALQGIPFSNRITFGLLKPKKQILGSDVAGRVEAAGKDVRHLRPGDEVFGDLSGRWGGFAEYVCAGEKAVVRKPAGVSFEQAAAIPQAATLALQGLVDTGGIRPGQRLLINGAGGGVGTFGRQIARLHEVGEVTGVDAPEKLDLLRSLGFDKVVDYSREDFTRLRQRYDLILDVKTNRSVFAYLRALRPGGTYVTVGGATGSILQALLLGSWIARLARKRIVPVFLKPNKDLAYLGELVASGEIEPVIDKSYDFAELPKAMRCFAAGRQKGKLVVRVGTEDWEPTAGSRELPPV